MTRRGFTLFEVVVALAISGVVVLLAHRLFSVMADATRRLDAARTALDRQMNAHRWLRDAFLTLEVGQPGDVPFEGHEGKVTFTATLATADGWRSGNRATCRSRDMRAR